MQKQIEFIIPDGYIKDEENSTSEKIIYRLKKEPESKSISIAKNWNEVCKIMFPVGDESLFITPSGNVDSRPCNTCIADRSNLTSEDQGEKLMAINQLMTVAKYLNSLKCYPMEEFETRALYIERNGTIETYKTKLDFVVFNTEEAALKAIEILGKDVIKLALTANNY